MTVHLRSILVIFILLAFTLADTLAEGVVFRRVRILEDPYRYTWDVEEGGIGGLVRFFADVNGDKKDDIIIGSKSLMKPEGGTFHIFIALHDGYLDTGPIQLNPRKLLISKKTSKGLANLKTIIGDPKSGQAVVKEWHYTGLVYELNSQEKYSQKKHRSIVARLPFRLEESGKTLLWTP